MSDIFKKLKSVFIVGDEQKANDGTTVQSTKKEMGSIKSTDTNSMAETLKNEGDYQGTVKKKFTEILLQAL